MLHYLRPDSVYTWGTHVYHQYGFSFLDAFPIGSYTPLFWLAIPFDLFSVLDSYQLIHLFYIDSQGLICCIHSIDQIATLEEQDSLITHLKDCTMTSTLEYKHLCAGIHRFYGMFLFHRNDTVENCTISFKALIVHDYATIQHKIPFHTHSILDFHWSTDPSFSFQAFVW